MFGTVRPRPCRLPAPDRRAYRRLTCGTCRALGDHGTAVRALTSYDAVLLGAIVDALGASDLDDQTTRCPIAPWIHRPIVPPQAASMRTAAAVQLLLADGWLADRACDGLPAAEWLRPLLPSDAAASALDALGLDPAPFRDIRERQAAVEHPGAEPDLAAGPTAALLEGLFRGLPDLEGTDPALVTASARAALARMGRALGRVIYLVDALSDLADDVASGAFNPCLDEQRRVRPERVERAADSLRAALDELSEAVPAFPWRRNQALLVDTVCRSLPLRAEAAIRSAGSVAAAAPLVPTAPQPWPVRLWAKLLSWWRDRRALASTAEMGDPEPEPGRKRKRRRGDDGDSDPWFCLACDCCDCCSCCGEGCSCDGCDICTCINCGECCTGCDCPCDGCG